MDFLIFGLEKPKLNFRQDLERGTVIWCDNEYVLDYDANKPIKWRDIKYKQSEMREIDRTPLSESLSVNFEQEWHDVVKELKGLCQTNVERVFLEKIGQAQKHCQVPYDDEEQTYKLLLNRPALIPQVWVNWIHYDPHDKERAERSHLEPFRVDFLYQGENEDGDFKRVIVEIDDIWHIADIEKGVEDFLKSPEATPSLERFTEHLRKDRWLRHHGWEVCRFSTLEVEKENCDYLYFEMQGEAESLGVSPDYFPHKE